MKRVFIFETTDNSRKIATEVLQNSGFEVFSMNLDNQNLYNLKKNDPDLVIINSSESIMENCLNLIQELKAIYNNKTVPVILAGNVSDYNGYFFDPLNPQYYWPIDDFIEADCSNKEFLHKVNLLINSD
jgi:response regulator RpfG family c-di-GMP phosphodiesterase